MEAELRGDRHAGEGTGQRCAGAGSGAGDAAGSASAVLKAGGIRAGEVMQGHFTLAGL